MSFYLLIGGPASDHISGQIYDCSNPLVKLEVGHLLEGLVNDVKSHLHIADVYGQSV